MNEPFGGGAASRKHMTLPKFPKNSMKSRKFLRHLSGIKQAVLRFWCKAIMYNALVQSLGKRPVKPCDNNHDTRSGFVMKIPWHREIPVQFSTSQGRKRVENCTDIKEFCTYTKNAHFHNVHFRVFPVGSPNFFKPFEVLKC